MVRKPTKPGRPFTRRDAAAVTAGAILGLVALFVFIAWSEVGCKPTGSACADIWLLFIPAAVLAVPFSSVFALAVYRALTERKVS